VDIRERRQRLCTAGYHPIPLFGKVPPTKGKNNPRKGLAGWQNLEHVTPEMIEMWAKTWPDARNTGVLTRLTPTLDLDILNEEAVRTIEDHVREHYEERGHVLVRIGKPPKRAILFRTIEPFAKILANVVAPSGAVEKIEFLAAGQQVVCFGTHPETRKLYTWHGGEPGKIARDDLPYIREEEARQLVDEIVNILVRDFNYTRAPERPKKRKSNGKDASDEPETAAADWQYLFDNIREGRALHDSLRDAAAKMVASGMLRGAAVNQLRALMEGSSAPHDERWRERYNEIPRLVDSAEKFRSETDKDPASDLPPSTLSETFEVFDRWLTLESPTPIYAVLGAVAANLLPGDPVWLGLVAPPSSAKTEILNSTSMLPHVVQAATLTPASLLSGTPKRQRDKGAVGGLLRQIGDLGILVLKDFTSILSMRADAKAEMLAALREIYDGAWTRHLGTDGGKTLAWKGKLGLIFGVTNAIDSHHSVIGAMGERFILNRLEPKEEGQFDFALKHVGPKTKQMRSELAEAVARLFVGRRAEPRPIAKDEIRHIDRTIALVVRLRGTVERDRYSREVEAVYGAEGTARIGLALERLLAGLDTLGVDRTTALNVVERVAMDSVPPLRRAAYEHLCGNVDVTGAPLEAETPDIAQALGLPTTTVRRALEELAAYRLVTRTKGGKADKWMAQPRRQEAGQ
jgi:Bifunctional DNA primase/polymerase, N-terminal